MVLDKYGYMGLIEFLTFQFLVRMKYLMTSKHCKTLLFGGYFYLALLAVKTKNDALGIKCFTFILAAAASVIIPMLFQNSEGDIVITSVCLSVCSSVHLSVRYSIF